MTTSSLSQNELVSLPEQPETGMPASPRGVTLIVCTTCRRAGQTQEEVPAGKVLAETLAAYVGTGNGLAGAEIVHGPSCPDSDAVAVRAVQCLGNCRRGPSVALARPGAWTYLFGDLPESDLAASALLQGAALLAGSSDGLMPWRGRPEPLKRGLIARIPPLDLA